MAYSGYFDRPGYAPRPAAGSAFTPAPSSGFTPYTPDKSVQDRMRAGSKITEGGLLRRAASIGQKYQPQRTAQISDTRAKLKQYGGYNVNDDGSITTDPNARPGQAYRSAYGAERDMANAHGMMDSSFAAKQIGAAFGRLSAEAQAVISQHAVSMNQIISQEAADFDEINTSLTTLYGDEAQYLLDNPPPPPDLAPAPGAAPTATGHPNQAPAGVNQAAMSPGFRVLGNGNVVTTYAKNDLTPANRKKLASQFPGYTLAISGDGRVVMKKVS